MVASPGQVDRSPSAHQGVRLSSNPGQPEGHTSPGDAHRLDILTARPQLTAYMVKRLVQIQTRIEVGHERLLRIQRSCERQVPECESPTSCLCSSSILLTAAM